MGVRLALSDAPEDGDRLAVLEGLRAFNQYHAGPSRYRALAVLIVDDGVTRGGLIGQTSRDWLFVELLYVPEDLRRSGYGRQIMQLAEDEARARGCIGIHLDTLSFQARGFYEKLGFDVFGTLEDFPPGHSRFYLHKRLA